MPEEAECPDFSTPTPTAYCLFTRQEIPQSLTAVFFPALESHVLCIAISAISSARPRGASLVLQPVSQTQSSALKLEWTVLSFLRAAKQALEAGTS